MSTSVPEKDLQPAEESTISVQPSQQKPAVSTTELKKPESSTVSTVSTPQQPTTSNDPQPKRYLDYPTTPYSRLPDERLPRRVDDSEVGYKEELPRGKETDFSEREKDWDNNRSRRFEHEYREDIRGFQRERSRDREYGGRERSREREDRYLRDYDRDIYRDRPIRGERFDDRELGYGSRSYRDAPRYRRSRSRERRYPDTTERPVFPTLGPQIFVAKVPPYATLEEITSIFREYGPIREITPKRGFCFVEYERIEDAEKAYFGAQGRNLLNHSLIIQIAGARARNKQSEQCWSCNDYGHISRDCPSKRREVRGPETFSRGLDRRRDTFGSPSRVEGDDYYRGREEPARMRDRDYIRYDREEIDRPYRDRVDPGLNRPSQSPRTRDYPDSPRGMQRRGYLPDAARDRNDSRSRSGERSHYAERGYPMDRDSPPGGYRGGKPQAEGGQPSNPKQARKKSLLSDDYYENDLPEDSARRTGLSTGKADHGPQTDASDRSEKHSRMHDESTSASVQRSETSGGPTLLPSNT